MSPIRTNSNTPSSDPIPEHIYRIHQSLVDEGIITHPDMVNCSKQWTNKIERHIPDRSRSQRLKRCHYVNHCPICNHLLKEKVIKQMNPYRRILLDNGGRNLLITLTLRHKNHPLELLHEVLTDAVPRLKDSRTWKNKIFPSKERLYTMTEYELSWSEEFGFNPHCHLMVGTTSSMPEDEIQSGISKEWRKTVQRLSNNSNLIPSYAKGVDVTNNPSGKHSKDKDPYGLDNIRKLQKKSNKKLKERFRKKDSFSKIQMQYHISEKTFYAEKFITILKKIPSYIYKTFRSLFFNPNRRHPLFSQVTPLLK